MVVFLASNLAGDSCCEEILHVIVVDVVEVNLVLAFLKVVLNVGANANLYHIADLLVLSREIVTGKI